MQLEWAVLTIYVNAAFLLKNSTKTFHFLGNIKVFIIKFEGVSYMFINFRYPDNFPSIILTVFAWGIIGYFIYKLYKKQSNKPRFWKALLVMLIGMFSFTFNFSLVGALIRLPILPLGVWMLFFYFKNKRDRWQVYRRYAWFGFAAANGIFIVATLLTPPIHHLIYPKDGITSYLSDVDESRLIAIHPSATEESIMKNSIKNFQVESFEQGLDWYYDRYNRKDDNQKIKERFPYMLLGTSSKWGSGYHPIVYVEDDGKGLLISVDNEQVYFRADQSLFKEGE